MFCVSVDIGECALCFSPALCFLSQSWMYFENPFSGGISCYTFKKQSFNRFSVECLENIRDSPVD